MINHLIKLFTRDLNQLCTEIEAYKKEENLWKTSGEISNCAGNLALHLCGNLKHFIGAKLGDTGYIREREKEFSTKNVSRDELLRNIRETEGIVISTLSTLDAADLENDFDIPGWSEKVTTGYWLIHLTTHFNYHLGQINYHRRLLDN